MLMLGLPCRSHYEPLLRDFVQLGLRLEKLGSIYSADGQAFVVPT